jgi:uncharacterized membrane protein YeiH
MILCLLDLLGVAVFSVSGALAAGRLGLDVLGVLVFGALTAIGGGTVRDLLMNRHPVFWMARPVYLSVIAAAAMATVVWVQFFPVPAHALLVADALGLALFALSGAQLAEAARLSPAVVVLMGTLTGTAGGVLRDLCSNQVPLLFRKDIYATAAIAGIVLYLVLKAAGVKHGWAFGLGLLTVAALRLCAIAWGWQMPVFRLPG